VFIVNPSLFNVPGIYFEDMHPVINVVRPARLKQAVQLPEINSLLFISEKLK